MSLRFIGIVLLVLGTPLVAGGYYWHHRLESNVNAVTKAANERTRPKLYSGTSTIKILSTAHDSQRGYGPLANYILYVGIGAVTLGCGACAYDRLRRKTSQ